MGAQGFSTLDFGSTPTDTASVVVTGQTGILSTSEIEAYFMSETSADNGTDEHQEAASLCMLSCGAIVAGTGFTIYAHCLAMLGIGRFTVHWVWN